MRPEVRGLLCGLMFTLPVVGCHSGARPAASVQSGAVKQYAVKGIIVGTDPAHGEVTIDTEEIPIYVLP